MASSAKRKIDTAPKKALEESSEDKTFYCHKCELHFKTYREITYQSPNHTEDVCGKEKERLANERAKAEAEKKAKLVGRKNKNKSREQNRKNNKVGTKNNKKITGKKNNSGDKNKPRTGQKNISGEKNKPRTRKNR